MWFRSLFGFRETNGDQVRANLKLDGNRIASLANGRSFVWGRLETPKLSDLRTSAEPHRATSGRLRVSEVVGDVQQLHQDPENEGALFQVASQFNLLEMVAPSVSPEHGVDGYENDWTQGPACAIAAGAGTVYRNYFTDVDGQIGQTADRQIDCLSDLGASLGNDRGRLWAMHNGYALATAEGLTEIRERLSSPDESERDALRKELRIGVQWNTEVTLNDTGHLVTQTYNSALPVAYSSHRAELWEPFATLVLEASYEATLCAAIVNAAETGNRRVFLTLLGGGAFGNRGEWILSAAKRALRTVEDCGLDVSFVSFRRSNPDVCELARRFA
ncbi:MAG: hypothetical protein AAF517_28590 [Planctomycetota bacterium]